MDFKNVSLKSILPIFILGLLLIGLLLWKLFFKTDTSDQLNNETQGSVDNEQVKDNLMNETMSAAPPIVSQPMMQGDDQEDEAIEQQLDRDRLEQKETKDLRIKLEQINLELQQEKALAELNKFKKENMGAFNEPAENGQGDLPEVKVDYIGGDSAKKEAILSIGGESYQVREKSNPTNNIQIVSITDSGVTLHFSTPQNLTKTVDYKPE